MYRSFNVTLSSGTQTINSLTADGSLTISAGALDILAASRIDTTFTLVSGVLLGAGSLIVNGTMNSTGGL